MSRRRPVPRTPSAVPGYRSIRVVCTDRGQHPEVSFGALGVWPEGDGWHVDTNQLSFDGDEYVDLAALDGHPLPGRLHKTYPLRCPRCKRNVPLKRETIERIGAALATNDTAELDLSGI